MTYEVYGTGGTDAKIRVEGIAAEVKVAWGVNVVNSNVSYLVLYVDVPYQQGLQIRYTAWDGNGNVSRGPMNITPCNGDNYRYDISVYNCNFVTAGYDHSDPQKKVFTANNGNLYYMWTDEMQQQVRAYFDNYVPGQGVGEVTLQTDAPSQLLTFTSQKLGQSFKYWIRGNTTIELVQEQIPTSGLEVTVYDRTYQREAGTRPWDETVATIEEPASSYVGIMFCYVYGPSGMDTRWYFSLVGNSRRMSAADGCNITGAYTVQPRETTRSISETLWMVWGFTYALDLTLKYTLVRFKGITEWYTTHSQSGSIYTALINVGDVMLSDPGIYVMCAYIDIQGDYDETFLEAVYADGSQISSNCIFDDSGYQNVKLFSIFEISEAQQLSFHAKCSQSRSYNFGVYFVKIASGSLSMSTFSATITSTLSQVGSIQLSPGTYLIEIDSSFNNANMKYYQELRKGNTVIIKDSTYAGSTYATTINACCYVELLATTTLTLYAKCDANSASLSGFIRALKVVDTGS